MKEHTQTSLRFIRGLLPQSDDYRHMRRAPLQDLLAGVTVALVALPLALAFGVASGLGAQAGLVTAILAGILAAVFGGSNLQVSGPTGAMTVVLVPVVHQYGPAAVLQVGVMAGGLLLLLSVSGIGRYVRYLPNSLVEGFTAGIAVVIALQQVPAMFGTSGGDSEQVWRQALTAVQQWVSAPNWFPPLIAIGVTAAILVIGKLKPAIPASLVVVVIVSVLVALAHLDVATIGALPHGIPQADASFWHLADASKLLSPAIAVAALAALESLLCASVADGMSVGERHNPDRELFGQGIANLVVPFFGGVPATAAIARTAVNVRSGARSRLSSITHSLVLLAIVMLLAPQVALIPLSALAGVLFATAIQMVSAASVRTMLRATRSDALTFTVTFIVTVMIDLVTAVVAGMAVATLLVLRGVSRSARLNRVPLESGDHSAEELALLAQQIVAFRFDGPLFFGAAHRFLLELTSVSDVEVLILRMSRVTRVDVTGAQVLSDAIEKLEHHGVTVLLSGIRPGHQSVLDGVPSVSQLSAQGRVFATTPEAIGYAKELVSRT